MFDQINIFVLTYSCTVSNIYLILCSHMQNIMFWLFLEDVLYIIKIIDIYTYLNSVFNSIWMYYLFKLCCIFLFNILVLLLLYVLFIFNTDKSVMVEREILIVIWIVNAWVVTNFTLRNIYFGHSRLFFFFFFFSII